MLPLNKFHSEKEYRGYLRDWFAGQALTALFTSQYIANNAEGYAVDAYALADAMLEERDK